MKSRVSHRWCMVSLSLTLLGLWLRAEADDTDSRTALEPESLNHSDSITTREHDTRRTRNTTLSNITCDW